MVTALQKTGAETNKRNGARQITAPARASDSTRESNDTNAKNQSRRDPLQETLERAAAKAGVSVEQFAKLPVKDQNAFLIETKADAEHPENVAPPTRWESPDAIDRSPFNRDHFDQAALEELTANVRLHGVLQPLLVRPSPGKPGRFEIVFGERRWRAAKAARLPKVPLTVRNLTDEEAIELQGIENLQREDLNPIDEARHYQQLLDLYHKRGLDPAAAMALLIEKSSKAKSTIYGKLRLIKLPAPVQEQVLAGKLPPSHAELITKLDDPKEAKRVAANISTMSYREAEEEIEHAQERIENARAHAKLREEFKAKHRLILSEEDNKKLFPWEHSSQPDHNSKFITLEQTAYEYPGYKKWQDLLGKDAPEPVLAQLHNGKPLLVYPLSECKAALKKKGIKPIGSGTSSRGTKVDHASLAKRDAALREKERERKAREQRYNAAMDQIAKAAERVSGDSQVFWAWLAEEVDGELFIPLHAFTRVGIKSRSGKTSEALKKLTAKKIRALVVMSFVDRGASMGEAAKSWDKEFLRACQAFGVKPPPPFDDEPKQASGLPNKSKKTRDFVVSDPKGLTRHGRQLKKGTRFWIKKSSSHSHVDRWLSEGRISEV